MRLVVVLALLSSVVLLSQGLRTDFVLTPHGYRYPECVLQVPSGAKVTEDGPNLKISLPLEAGQLAATEKLYAVPKSCQTDIQDIKRIMASNNNSININGWLDYGGWYPPGSQSDLHSFTSTYTIPQDPTDKTGGQTLFYFIGMQDNDSPAYLNIIQPVLTWGNGRNQWYVQSWACCPSNISVSSPPLVGLQAGQTMQGIVVRQTADIWLINSVWQGKDTSLHAQVGDMNYNWADVTLEVYNVNACSQFANGRATFAQLDLKDAQGKTLNPSWTFTSPTSCQGSISQTGSTTVVITHN